MKENIERMINLKEQYENRSKKALTDLKKEFAAKAKYYDANKELEKIENESPLKRKYKREMEDFDSRIEYHKNTLRYTIEDMVNNVEKINKEIEPYVSQTETKAQIQNGIYEKQKKELEVEIENLKKKRDMYPEYNRLYTEEGKKEYAELEASIEGKEKELQNIDVEIQMNQDRENLLKIYIENLAVKKEGLKLANKYGLKLRLKSQEEKKEEKKKDNKEENKKQQEEQQENKQEQEENQEEQQENKQEEKQEEQQEHQQEQEEKQEENKQNYDIQKVYISEKDKKVKLYNTQGEIEKEILSINGISGYFDRMELYKKTDVRRICKELTKNKKEFKKLKKKINPNILKAYSMKSYELVEEYIKSIKEEKELPLEVIHDLEGLNPITKFFKQRSKVLKAEEKCGVKILNKLFDKNKTLNEQKENNKNEQDKENNEESKENEENRENIQENKENEFKKKLDLRNWNDDYKPKHSDEELKLNEEDINMFQKIVHEQKSQDKNIEDKER